MPAPDTRFLDVPGGRLAYEVEGDGHPLTLIHAGVAHLRMWDEQVPAFAERYRVIRYDTRGFGQTRSDDVPFSNREDLLRLLDHLGVERTHLLGISRGGTIALDFALEHPERVSALVIGATTPGGFEFEAPEMEATWTRVEELEDAGNWEPLVELETQIWTDGMGQPPDRVRPDIRERMVRWNLENYRADGGNGHPQPLQPPAAGRLSEVSVPTLVTWGDLDVRDIPAGGAAMVSGIAGARQHVFKGAAHMINLEFPDEFNRLVLDFLAEAERAQA
jgi:pimeloyl-ACP methyl ester carboxylesterase